MKLLINVALVATVATVSAKLVSDHIKRVLQEAREEAKRALKEKEEEFEREKQALNACIEEQKAENAEARSRQESAARELEALHGDVQQLLLASTRLKFAVSNSARAKQRCRRAGGAGGELSRRGGCSVRSVKVARGTQTKSAGFGMRRRKCDTRNEPEHLNGNHGFALVNSVRKLLGMDDGPGQRRRNETHTLRPQPR